MTRYYAELDDGPTGRPYGSSIGDALVRDRFDGCTSRPLAVVRDLPTAIIIANLLNTQEAK